MNWLRDKWQVIKFQIVGVINTVVDYVIFNLLYWFGLGLLPAQCFGYGSGLLNSYLMNKRWTFEQRTKSSSHQIVRFLVVNAITFGINTTVLYVCVQGFGLAGWLGKAVATVVTLAANYIGYSRWVFTEEKKN